MKQTVLAAYCILLAVLCGNSLIATAATVRPYKFGFTIEEQQHRAEQRDENGIVMGEFGFITADGKYHVTVYATDENGKFRIISMKSFPYNGPPGAPNLSVATTTRAPPPKHNFGQAACSGCFLTNSAPTAAANGVSGLSPAHTTGQHPSQHHKTEIRPLSLPLTPLSPADIADPGKLPVVYQKQAFKLAQLAVSQLQAQGQGQPQGQPQGHAAQVTTAGQAQSTATQAPGLAQTLSLGQSQSQLQGVSLSQTPGLSAGLPQGLPIGTIPVSPAGQSPLTSAGLAKIPEGQAQVVSVGQSQAASADQAQLASVGPNNPAIQTQVSSPGLAAKNPVNQAQVASTGQIPVPLVDPDQEIPADLAFSPPLSQSGPVRVTATGQIQGQLLGLPLGGFQVTSAGQSYVDRGVNVLLPFQQSIVHSIDAALAESQTHKQIAPTPQHPQNQQQHTAPTQYESRPQPLHIEINPSTFQSNALPKEVPKVSINLANAQRIPPATTGPKELLNHAFGAAPVKKQQQSSFKPTQGLQPIGASSNQVSQVAYQPLQTHLNPSTFEIHQQPQKVQKINIDLAHAQKIPAATTGPKELQSHAFGTPIFGQKGSQINGGVASNQKPNNKPAVQKLSLLLQPAIEQKQVNKKIHGAPLTASSAAKPLNHSVEQSMKQVVLPVTNKINKIVAQAQHKGKVTAATSHVGGASFSTADRLNRVVVASMQNVALPVSQTVPKLVVNGQHINKNTPQTQYTTLHKPNTLQQATGNKLAAEHTHSTPTHIAAASENRPLITPAFGAVGNAAGGNNGLAQTATNAQNLPASGQSIGSSPNVAATATKTGTGSTPLAKQPALAVTGTQSGTGSALTSTQTGSGQTGQAGEAGDLYKFKYLLDYNGHEETGSRNGNKEGNYFAIGEDDVARTIEYIANEFGFQPHVSWRKLDQSEVANLPVENSLKHYEFKWFTKASE